MSSWQTRLPQLDEWLHSSTAQKLGTLYIYICYKTTLHTVKMLVSRKARITRPLTLATVTLEYRSLPYKLNGLPNNFFSRQNIFVLSLVQPVLKWQTELNPQFCIHHKLKLLASWPNAGCVEHCPLSRTPSCDYTSSLVKGESSWEPQGHSFTTELQALPQE